MLTPTSPASESFTPYRQDGTIHVCINIDSLRDIAMMASHSTTQDVDDLEPFVFPQPLQIR